MENVLFSSESVDWETPQDVFDKLDAEFRFTLDPCATAENAKCERFYTLEDDGLVQPWGGERVFCNPPYGRGVVRWFQKAWKEIVVPGTVVVMLVHARTDTVWWQGYVQGRAEVRFIPGRLHFGGKDRAPFPSAVVIYRAPGVIPGREWR